MIKLRIDVDYPYPSRAKSFAYTGLRLKISKKYLKNAKIIAKMVNKSPKRVMAYWFFTYKTIPDIELLNLLNNKRHEIALHVVNHPKKELEFLEKMINKKVKYYTIHGTTRFLARIMWKRWKKENLTLKELKLKPFFNQPTLGLDKVCWNNDKDVSVKIAKKHVNQNYILYFHPIWLFEEGKINRRGPIYETLTELLIVDEEFKTLKIHKKLFFSIAKDQREYETQLIPKESLTINLKERGADIFTFIEGKWISRRIKHNKTWFKTSDNIALLKISIYDEWLKNIGKKTRNMIRKAKKKGVKVKVVEPNQKLAEGIWNIFNETPIRQERKFLHYGETLKNIKKNILTTQNCIYIVAYYQEEIIGFIKLIKGKKISIISQILSMKKHWDKAVNNLLIAKLVETSRKNELIMYGRMGNHPKLDKFKRNNGFEEFKFARFYKPLTKKGRIAIKLGLQKDLKDALPKSIKYPLIPIYNWISRTKIKIKNL